jgi:hypothetical protein
VDAKHKGSSEIQQYHSPLETGVAAPRGLFDPLHAYRQEADAIAEAAHLLSNRLLPSVPTGGGPRRTHPVRSRESR